MDNEAKPDRRATILYVGEINRTGYHAITSLCKKLAAAQEVTLVLVTYGGDPHAGFRIGRCLQHNFERISILVPDQCKSAGTLVAIAGSEIVMSDRAELGPLDVQVIKSEELFERVSGLDLPQSINALKFQTLTAFREALIDMRIGGRLSTKIAGELAAKLTTGLFAPIYAQIDPLRLGELQRANAIGHQYGLRLSEKAKNLKQDALAKLVAMYPSHGFVIDRKEARTLFKRVRAPDPQEMPFLERLYPHIETMLKKPTPVVTDVSDMFHGDHNAQKPDGENDVRDAARSTSSDEGSGSAVDGNEQGNRQGEPGAAPPPRTKKRAGALP